MKQLQFISAVALALLATACSNEIDDPVIQSGNEAEIMLNLQLPEEIRTYTFGDGTSAPRLQYAVYQHTTDGSVSAPVITGTNVTAFADGSLSTTQKFKVITGVEYDFVFFADNTEGEFEFDSATATITDNDAADGTIDGNKETRDAFFGVLTLKVTGPFSASVELRRPFAQLNLGTDDLDEQIVATTFGTGLTNLKTSVQTETYKTLNLLTGEASDKVSVTFGSTGIPDNTVENFPVENYDYLSMNYLLMPNDLTRQNCVFTIFNGDTEVRNFTVPNVPVQRNYRTNVYGTLLTTDGEVKIDIKPEFSEPDHFVALNAETLVAGLNAGGTVEVPEGVTIDITDATPAGTIGTGYEITAPATLVLKGNLKSNNGSQLIVKSDLKIIGDPESGEASLNGNDRGLIYIVDGGSFTAENVTFNTPNAYRGNDVVSESGGGDVTLRNCTFNSRNGSVYFEPASSENVLTVENCTVNNFSKNSNTTPDGIRTWAYAIRAFGGVSNFRDNVMTGIQGIISADYDAVVNIYSGTYTVHDSEPGKGDGFYAVYTCTNGTCNIYGGSFSSPRFAIYNGNNDTTDIFGHLYVYGGNFSDQGWDQQNKTSIKVVDGYKWQAIEGDSQYKWTVVKETPTE